MANIHIYQGAVTGGGTNGTQVSEGTGVSPIVVGPLKASLNEESDPIKLAIRCESGYEAVAGTTITPTGTTASKWALAPDNAGSPGTFGSYGAALTISGVIGTTNTIFWAKAKATSGEAIGNDTSVDLVVAATIAAA